ncbi:LOB domain-containing protein 1 [Citrus sinensis]|uniref:LOB domain-containing protein 1 n=1 Tax=Citrus sinensis TaxID=2711 RepID=A0ACB8ID36_CITSI|nr:LOB domain-containing protein 1 [Citrus sinensis]
MKLGATAHVAPSLVAPVAPRGIELPEPQRADAVTSMVYEANSRIRDPVYGCAGAVGHMQKQVSELQAELAKAQAGLASMQSQQQNLIALICMEMAQSQEQVLHRHQQQQPQQQFIDTSCFLDEYSLGSTWEPLWT